MKAMKSRQDKGVGSSLRCRSNSLLKNRIKTTKNQSLGLNYRREARHTATNDSEKSIRRSNNVSTEKKERQISSQKKSVQKMKEEK